VGSGVDGEGGVVGVGDGRDDGQAEAFAVGGPGGGPALEGLEQSGGLAGGDDRPGVGDLDPRLAAAGGDLDADPAVGMLWRIALSIRLAASRCSRRASPRTGAAVLIEALMDSPRPAASASWAFRR
jgi:hypothetical protein